MIGRACPNYKNCKNNSFCQNCDGTSLFDPIYKERIPTGQKRKGQKTEKHVVKKINKDIKRKIEKAYKNTKQNLTPNSGALSIKGDSISYDLMLEIKERQKILKGGNKSISIQKSWLEKLEKEANGRYFALPFKFGEDEDKIYAVIDYDVLCQIYSDIVYLKELLKNNKSE